MPEVKFRAGLVGAGYISEYHVAALRRLPQVELVGIVDLNQEAAERVAAKAGTRAYGSLKELRDAGAEVIHVLTPPSSHFAVAREAIELGCHVLVEKPLAEDPEDCLRLEELAARHGVQLCANHSLLFDPQVRNALEVVRSGKLGRIVSLDIIRSSSYPAYGGGPLPPQYRAAGYPFRDLGVHALYLCEAFLGPIKQVDAAWQSVGGEPNLAFDEWRAQVQCRDGLANFQLSWNVRPQQSQLIIQGTRGVLRVDLFLMFQAARLATPLPKPIERVVNALTDSVKPLVDVPKGVWGFLRKKVLPYHGLQDLVAEFYRALEHGTAMPTTAREAARVVEWTEHVARAADREHEQRVAALPRSAEVPVLVTGASGGLGRAIVDRLRAEGIRTRIFVRRIPAHIPEGIEVALGDLGDPAAVERAVAGAELVIHAGAAMKGGWTEHECATITGTRNVLESCLKHGVRKLVHISSMSVVDWGGGAPGSVIDENTAHEPRPKDRGTYTAAKLEAERLVTRCVQEQGLKAVILRPGQIYGGAIPLLTPAVARRIGKRWLVLGNGNLRLPLVHMDDVVEAVFKAAHSELERGEIIQLVADNAPTQNEVLRATQGPGARIIRVPLPVVYALGGLSEVALGLLGRKSPLSRYRLSSALTSRTFACRNAPLLGWSARVDNATGIKQQASPRRPEEPAPAPEGQLRAPALKA